MKRTLPVLLLLALSSVATQVSAQAPASGNPIPGDYYWSGAGAGSSPSSAPASGVRGDTYWGGDSAARASIPSSAQGVTADSVFGSAMSKTNVPWVRAQVIQDAASAFGAQSGMAAKAKELNDSLAGLSSQYDKAFNFGALMLEPGFLPPVISEGRDAYNQPNPNEVRAADRIYKIEFPARFVNTPPLWQDYLGVPVSPPLVPDQTALPTTPDERVLWDEFARRGWEQGQRQAEAAFESNLARLRRDFEGMLRFKILYEQGVVTKPTMAKQFLGVTGGGTEMAVNDRVYTIAKPSELDPNTSRWSQEMPVTHHTDALLTKTALKALPPPPIKPPPQSCVPPEFNPTFICP